MVSRLQLQPRSSISFLQFVLHLQPPRLFEIIRLSLAQFGTHSPRPRIRAVLRHIRRRVVDAPLRRDSELDRADSLPIARHARTLGQILRRDHRLASRNVESIDSAVDQFQRNERFPERHQVAGLINADEGEFPRLPYLAVYDAVAA